MTPTALLKAVPFTCALLSWVTVYKKETLCFSQSKTALGDHLTNVRINRDNVSEILQIYMKGHCEQTELAALALSLRTKAFQAHSPSQKASLLAFLVNELCCSKAVIR